MRAVLPFRLGLPLALVMSAVLMPRPAAADDLLVFAAASLKTALDEAAASWNRRPEADVTISYAGSSVLARQIQQGAPAEVFISASVEWMDLLEDEGLIDTPSRRDLFGNRLVLIAHLPDATPVELGPGLDLAALLGDGRLAMALVDAVPAGIYGREALTSLGAWDAVAPMVVQTDNVRAALALVARGEAPYGIVYATDAAAEPGVTMVGTFPETSHAPIVYPAATTASAPPDAEAFLDFIASDAARPVFAAQGFTFPDE
jgi:molybdate transport system substrate-binding protein